MNKLSSDTIEFAMPAVVYVFLMIIKRIGKLGGQEQRAANWPLVLVALLFAVAPPLLAFAYARTYGQ